MECQLYIINVLGDEDEVINEIDKVSACRDLLIFKRVSGGSRKDNNQVNKTIGIVKSSKSKHRVVV